MVIAKIAKGVKALTKRVKASKSKRRLKRKSKIVGGVDPKYRKDPVYVKEKRAQAFLHKRATPSTERGWLGEVGPASRGLKKRNKRPTNPTYHVRAEQAYKTGRYKPKIADKPMSEVRAKKYKAAGIQTQYTPYTKTQGNVSAMSRHGVVKIKMPDGTVRFFGSHEAAVKAYNNALVE